MEMETRTTQILACILSTWAKFSQSLQALVRQMMRPLDRALSSKGAFEHRGRAAIIVGGGGVPPTVITMTGKR